MDIGVLAQKVFNDKVHDQYFGGHKPKAISAQPHTLRLCSFVRVKGPGPPGR